MIDLGLVRRLRETVVSVTAPWWRGERVSANRLIYGLNTGGHRPPLLWCFQGYEEFAALAQALGPEQPLYGMRSGHLVVDYSPINQLHLVLAYAEEVLSLDLPLPVLIGGNCQGGHLAQRIAHYLTLIGRPVALLAILNPLAAAPYAGPTALIRSRYDDTNPTKRFHGAEALWRINYPHGTADTIPAQHGRVFQGAPLRHLVRVLGQRLAQAADAFPGTFPLAAYGADLKAPDACRVAPGELFEIPVEVTNTTAHPWPATAQSQLWVGNHWRDAAGRTLQWLDAREPLGRGLAPGQSADLTLTLRAPETPGDYRLDLDLEHAGIAWFSELGNPSALCRVQVAAED